MRARLLIALGALAAALIAGLWALLPAPALPLADFTEHGVRVSISLERHWLGAAVLVARYTPDVASGHLYSIDLPRGGVDGVGRPTLLEIPSQPGLRPTGLLSADRAPIIRQLEGFSAPLPIYPDGPVTLRLPVVAEGGQATLSVTYMACSSEGYCLPPVIGREVRVSIPARAQGAAGTMLPASSRLQRLPSLAGMPAARQRVGRGRGMANMPPPGVSSRVNSIRPLAAPLIVTRTFQQPFHSR
jgi:hypothetical protein